MFLASQKSPEAWLHWLLGYRHGQGHIHQAPEDVNNLTDAWPARGGAWRLDNMDMCSFNLKHLKHWEILRTHSCNCWTARTFALAKLRRRKWSTWAAGHHHCHCDQLRFATFTRIAPMAKYPASSMALLHPSLPPSKLNTGKTGKKGKRVSTQCHICYIIARKHLSNTCRHSNKTSQTSNLDHKARLGEGTSIKSLGYVRTL